MNISRYLPFLKKKKKTRKTAFFFRLHEKLPKLNFTLSIVIAAVGILFLLLFPFLLLTLPFELYDAAINAEDLNGWTDAVILFFIIALAGAFSWSIYKLKFSLPTGLEITKEKFPHLLKLTEELQAEFHQPKINRIIIRDKYEIRVLKTPRSKMPFLNTRTLIIGLPVLLAMPPLYFRALLARRIGQLSTRHTPISTRLYFLDDIWAQFKTSSKRSKNAFTKVLRYFFQIYSPLYHTMLMPLLQEEELEADSYGMDLVNSEDMVECIVYEEVVTQFLKNKFWPKIYHMTKNSKTPEFLPYSQITKVVKTAITDAEISEAIQAALKLEVNHPAAMPSLTKRLNHLGHDKPRPPKRLSTTAAEHYLGNHLEKIVSMFNKRWLAKIKGKI